MSYTLQDIEEFEEYRLEAQRKMELEKANRDMAMWDAYHHGDFTAAEVAAAAGVPISTAYQILTAVPCSEPGCTNKVKAKGLCNLHYARKRRGG